MQDNRCGGIDVAQIAVLSELGQPQREIRTWRVECHAKLGNLPVPGRLQWYRLYDIAVLDRGKPWHFKYLTVNHIYYPLAEQRQKY
jgi:hypothetical protein